MSYKHMTAPKLALYGLWHYLSDEPGVVGLACCKGSNVDKNHSDLFIEKLLKMNYNAKFKQ